MNPGLKPYPAYRDSGVEWLGQVPEHWGVRRLKQSFRRIVGGSTPKSGDPRCWGGDIVWVTPSDVSKAPRLTDSLQHITVEGLASCSTELVPPGSIVLTSRAPVGNVAVAQVELCTNQGCKALVATEGIIDPLFALPLLNTLKSELQSLAVGTTFSEISTSRLSAVPTPVPPLPEQATIVRFLDYMDRRVRRYVRAKRRLIKLIEEQKQAIVHRAVMRGLDPSVPFKPSGMPWLGDIPRHWTVQRAKHLFREVDERSVDGGEELLSVSHLTGVTPRSQKNITMFKAASYAGHKLCRPDDLVVNTMWAWAGALGVSTHTGIVSPAYAVYRPTMPGELTGAYVESLLRTRAYISNIICRSTGLRPSRLRLYPDEFLRLPIVQPPAEEQRRIVQFIQRETADVGNAISRLEREIELLHEYQTRLVADVVIGRLDVREAAAGLLDIAGDSTLIDDEDECLDEAEVDDDDPIEADLEESRA